jgi:hypothetical protein
MLSLVSPKMDSEDYWEWIIGKDPESGILVDIYRAWETKQGAPTEILFARYTPDSLEPLPEELMEKIAATLLGCGLGPVYFGRVRKREHEAFHGDVVRVWGRKGEGRNE